MVYRSPSGMYRLSIEVFIMEYMLLSDGSVKAFECLAMHEDVVDALHDYGGVAYYWWNDNFRWSCIKPDTPKVCPKQISDDALPDVIKLAAMLS
jgi:hypothetical protein